jgi:peptidoglycan/xylan/chitin deacetylase (PgdA/CDA1 family)
MYHRFGTHDDVLQLRVDVFERQMAYVKKNFRATPLSEVANRLKSGDSLPENSVVVTIDDGYADSCRLAAPILARYQIPATLFVVSDFVDRKLWLWPDAVRYLVHAAADNALLQTPAARLAGGELPSQRRRDLLWERIVNDLRPLPMTVKRQRIAELGSNLGVTLPELPTAEYEAVTWDELRRLDPRLFDVGSHTKSHAILSRCDAEELRIELEESKQTISERLDREVTAFCYPNGQREDYNASCVRAVQAAGYECAVVAHGGLLCAGADRYRIERWGPSHALSTFRYQLNGISHLCHRVRVGFGGH